MTGNTGILPYPPIDATGASLPPSRIAQGGASAGQVLKWSGSAWAPAADAGGGGTADLTRSSAWTITTAVAALEIEVADEARVWEVHWTGITIDDTAHSGGSPQWVADWWLWGAAGYDATARPTAGRRWGNGGTASIITLSQAATFLSDVYFSAGFPGTMTIEGRLIVDNLIHQGVRRIDIPWSNGWFNSGGIPRLATYRLMSSTADSGPASDTRRIRKLRLRMSDNKNFVGRVVLYERTVS